MEVGFLLLRLQCLNSGLHWLCGCLVGTPFLYSAELDRLLSFFR